MTTLGHNSGIDKKLVKIVERVERLLEERAGLQSDIKEVFEEAKQEGFDAKVLRKVIRLRSIPAAERQAEQDVIDTYMAALEGHDAAERRQSEADAT